MATVTALPQLAFARKRYRLSCTGDRPTWTLSRSGCRDATHKFKFLELPTELREIIYEYVAIKTTWMVDLKTRKLRVNPPYRKTDKYRTIVHPLCHVSRLVRKEFSYHISRIAKGRLEPNIYSSGLDVYVSDLNFDALISFLRRVRPLLSIDRSTGSGRALPTFFSRLRIHLDFTNPRNENWNALLRWAKYCVLMKTEKHLLSVDYTHTSKSYDVNSTGRSPLTTVHMICQQLLARHLPATFDLFRQFKLLHSSFHPRIFTSREERLIVHPERRAMKRQKRIHLDRQTKRLRIEDEDRRWSIEEGFNKYGERDEEYEAVVEGVGVLAL